MSKRKIAVFIGSLRRDSLNRKMADALIRVAPPSLSFEFIDIGHLPHYNQDLDDDGNPPAAWVEFRQKLQPFDGVLFFTPEYNRSVPGVLKNALDVGSRPYGKSVWNGKPGAVISLSPGALGGFGANHHLRQSLVFLNVPTLQQPEAYIGGAGSLFDASGNLVNAGTEDFLRNFAQRYAAWVEANAPVALAAAA
jgi:chromate reductase